MKLMLLQLLFASLCNLLCFITKTLPTKHQLLSQMIIRHSPNQQPNQMTHFHCKIKLEKFDLVAARDKGKQQKQNAARIFSLQSKMINKPCSNFLSATTYQLQHKFDQNLLNKHQNKLELSNVTHNFSIQANQT